MPRIIITFIFILVLGSNGAFSQVPDFCLTKEEYRLYSLINNYRTKNGLPIIPVSRSLCYVAKIHARDLFFNNPDTSSCSLNSWSDKGKWTACCHSRYTPNPVCIVNKPKELTGYAGEGHELAYWDSEELVPDTVLRFWQSIEQTREILLNQKKWNYFNWKAIGIGLYKGYACVWMGELADTIAEPKLCENNTDADKLVLPFKESAKDVVTVHTGRYYIIFGSFTTKDDAFKMAEKYRKEGLPNAKTLVIDQNTYRVSLSDHASQQEALDAKKVLGVKYKEAWVTKY
jgi:hypothetical protein